MAVESGLSVADRAIKVEIQTETEEHEPTKGTIESILDLVKTECFRAQAPVQRGNKIHKRHKRRTLPAGW